MLYYENKDYYYNSIVSLKSQRVATKIYEILDIRNSKLVINQLNGDDFDRRVQFGEWVLAQLCGVEKKKFFFSDEIIFHLFWP